MDLRESDVKRLQTQAWQKSALEYSRLIPELNYASRFYSKMLKRITIYPAIRDAAEKLTPIKDGLPVELLDRIQDPGGGRSNLLGQYGRLMFITGEGYLLGLNLNSDNERWSFVWNDEVELLDDGGVRHKPKSTDEGKVYNSSQAVAYRLWTPSPERSGEAESPMLATLGIAAELLILTKSVSATATSRLINGMIKVPAELSFGSEESGADDDAETNPFLAALIDHILGVVENAGTPEAAGPFLAEGAAEFLPILEWVRLHDPQNDYLEQGLRKEAIERLAHGLDFPAEYLKSLGDVNHWSARAITHEMWRTHGAPVAEQFCDDLSEEYLRRALRDANYERWREVVVAYDDANVVVPVDRTDDADKAFDRGQVSFPGYRSMKGIDESLAPTEEETRIYLAVKMRNPAFLEGTRYEIEEPEPAPFPPGPSTGDAPPDVEEGPPNPGRAGVSREESRASAMHGAAYHALHRCRERAGARIRSFHTRSANAAELALLDGHDNAQAAAVLGIENLKRCGFDAVQLVRGGSDGYTSICKEWGIEETQAKALGQMIEVHAAKSLTEHGLPSFPSGFFAQIVRASEVSHEIGDEGIVRRNNEALDRLERMLPPGETIKVGG